MKTYLRLCLGIALISSSTGCYCYGPYCPLLGWSWSGGPGCAGGACGPQYGAPAGYGQPMMGPQGFNQPYDAGMSAGLPIAPQTSYMAPSYQYSYPATAAAPLESLPTF